VLENSVELADKIIEARLVHGEPSELCYVPNVIVRYGH
jgi:hypothetical protein